MGVNTASDLNTFFDLSDFGVQALYTAAGKRPVTISGLFDNPSASESLTDLMDVIVPKPRWQCRTVDTPNAAEGDKLKVEGTSYVVRVVTTDGEGITSMLMDRG